MRKSKTTEQFIEEARRIHDNKYDYSKVIYINNHTKVCIICPIHGEFWQTPHAHLHGQNCPECAKAKRLISQNKDKNIKKMTTEEFINRAILIYGNKYDLSKVNYVDSKTKVCIICHETDTITNKEHGEFWISPYNFLHGVKCPKCSNKTRYTNEEFIDKLKSIYNNEIDYSKVNYINTRTKVCLICHKKDITGKEHGEFWATPNNLLKGHVGCPKCNGKYKYKPDEWREIMSIKHASDDYIYTKAFYHDAYSKVCIICKKHGEFWQTPHKHALGEGCPKCKRSTLEANTENYLMSNKIPYISQYKDIFPLNKSSKQSLDFYLPDQNIAIECQGEQHFHPLGKTEKSRKLYENIVERDNRKKNICQKNGIKLVYLVEERHKKLVPNDDYKYYFSINDLINDILCNHKNLKI